MKSEIATKQIERRKGSRQPQASKLAGDIDS
jgi:hypothetical protein